MQKDEKYYSDVAKNALSGGDVLARGQFAEPESVVRFGPGKEKPGEFSKWLIENYKTELPQFLADGTPSKDTLANYYTAIDQFLKWCRKIGIDPVTAGTPNIIAYRQFLIDSQFKTASVNSKLAAVRKFYGFLVQHGLIAANPAVFVHGNFKVGHEEVNFKFFSKDELKKIVNSINGNDIKSLRSKAIIMLMALEGLSPLEVYRLNVEDINFMFRKVCIRRKDREFIINLSNDTMVALRAYLDVRIAAPGILPVPAFVSVSNRSLGKRMSRYAIRKEVNKVLCNVGLYKKGYSCQTFRHTIGILLGAATGDANYIMEVLRNKNIKMASSYVHAAGKSRLSISDIINFE